MSLVLWLVVSVGIVAGMRAFSGCRFRAWLAARGLKSEHHALRHLAMRDLAKCGEPGLRRLAEVLADSSLREAVVDLMVEKGAMAAPVLVERLSDPRPEMRQAAAEALRRLGQCANEDLVHAYTHAADPLQRQEAGRLLVGIGGKQIIKMFLERLEETDPAARREAVEFLQSMKRSSVQKVLVDRLNLSNEAARMSAARSLGCLGYSGAVEPLLAALQDPHESVRAQAAIALAQLKAGQAVVPLTELLVNKGRARNCAVTALGDLRDRRAVPALRSVLEDEKRRACAIENRIQSMFGQKRDKSKSAMLFELAAEQREVASTIELVQSALRKLNC